MIRAADLREAAAVNVGPYLAVAWILRVMVAAFMRVADWLTKEFRHAATSVLIIAEARATSDKHDPSHAR